MVALMRDLFPLILILTAALSGCGNVCDQMCAAEAANIEECLPEWELSWAELGYEDQQDYLAVCGAEWGDGLDSYEDGSEDRADLAQECGRREGIAVRATDCQDIIH